MQSLVSLVFLNISNRSLQDHVSFCNIGGYVDCVLATPLALLRGKEAGCSCRLMLKLHQLLGTVCLYNCESSSSSSHCTSHSGLWAQDKYCWQKGRSRTCFVFERKSSRTLKTVRTSAGLFFPLYSLKESLISTRYLCLSVANNGQLQIWKQYICHAHLVRLCCGSSAGIPCVARNDNSLSTLLPHVLRTAL